MKRFGKIAAPSAAALLLASCSLPWGGTEGETAQTGSVSAEARPMTVEEFAARELSGAILEHGTGAGTPSPSAENLSPEDRLRAARAARRNNLFAAFVRRGDWYLLRDDREMALKAYMVALSRAQASPERKAALLSKIGDTYFSLKRFPEAVQSYREAGSGVTAESAMKFAFALSYAEDAERETLLPSLPLDADQKAYFAVSALCREGVDKCVSLIRDNEGTGALVGNLKKSLSDFEALAADDLAYRDALLAAAFAKNGDFATAAAITDAVLARRADYRPVQKLAGRAWWEMARYDKAASRLQAYYRAEPEDVEAAYLLGLCYVGKKDWETAAIYFNRAVLGKYEPRADAERQLAYAYAQMGAPENAWQVLGYLMKEPAALETDFTTAILLALSREEYALATQWTDAGLSIFPSSGWLLALKSRLSRLANELPKWKESFEASLAAEEENPLALLERGIWKSDNLDTTAESDFSKVLELDPDGPFGTDASARLAKNGSGGTLSETGSSAHPLPQP